MYALIALLLVVLIGAGGGYWAVKKIRTKQNQEFRYEGKITLLKEGVDPAAFKSAVLTDTAMDHALQELDLVKRWELLDAEAAKARLRQKFSVKVEGVEVTIGYRDKDKNLAKEILENLMKSFAKSQRPTPREDA